MGISARECLDDFEDVAIETRCYYQGMADGTKAVCDALSAVPYGLEARFDVDEWEADGNELQGSVSDISEAWVERAKEIYKELIESEGSFDSFCCSRSREPHYRKVYGKGYKDGIRQSFLMVVEKADPWPKEDLIALINHKEAHHV